MMLPLQLIVTQNGAGGYDIRFLPSSAQDVRPWEYPGMTCNLVNRYVQLAKSAVSEDGTQVTFTISYRGEYDVSLLWMVIQPGPSVEILTKPQVINAEGEYVFVIGPMEPFDEGIPITLDLNLLSEDGFALYINFLEIFERMAVSSDRLDPGGFNPKHIFTVDLDSIEFSQVTTGEMRRKAYPRWSPGAEWIAFEMDTEVTQGDTTHYGSHLYIVHPDGSNLLDISPGVCMAERPSFNPNGQLIIYDAMELCPPGNYSIDLYVYNIRTGEHKLLFRGEGHYKDQIYNAHWSPDGNYLFWKAIEDPVPATVWEFAPMDPLTGDSLGSPLVFIRNTKFELLSNGYYFRFYPWEITWAPDSRHMAGFVWLIRWVPEQSIWKAVYKGLLTWDFNEFLEVDPSSLPIVPDWGSTGINLTTGEAHFSCYNLAGDKLFFEQYYNSAHSDIEYTDTDENYAIITNDLRIKFLYDGYYYLTPALFVPAFKEFFPPPL